MPGGEVLVDVTGSVMVDNGMQAPDDLGAQRTRPPAPRRNAAMWAICVAVAVVVVVTVLEGARLGALSLAGVLVGAGVARLMVPGPGLVGLAVRSRGLDAAMYFSLAAVIAVLAQTAPNI